jgi:hypothetical protein
MTPIAIPVFDEQEYCKLLHIAADRQLLPRSHTAFNALVERCIHQVLRRRYGAVQRVPVDTFALAAWCRANGLPITGAARLEYAAMLLRAATAAARR